MKLQKLTALILAAALALTPLTACTNAKKNVESKNESKIQNTEKEDTMNVKQERSALANSYYKLIKDKELTIAYIGGSVTDGYGSSDQSQNSWAAILGRYLSEKYPDAKINNRKLSIGGTGSYLASYRYNREVAPQNPDLLFIEYAINDKYNGVTEQQTVRSSESIVRLALKSNPNIDIIYVLTFDSGTKDSDYAQLKAHKDVANYYGFPCIKMADKVYSMLNETGDEFSKYFADGVHPNDEGYKFYAKVICQTVSEELEKAAAAEEITYSARTVPQKTLCENPTLNADMLYANEIDLSNSHGWEYQPNAAYSWLGSRYNGRIFAKEQGAKLTFEFEGSDIGLATGIGKNMGTISVAVDNNPPVILDEYSTNANPKDRIIAENLEYGKHTVTIEVTDKNQNSGGYEFEIGAILIN